MPVTWNVLNKMGSLYVRVRVPLFMLSVKLTRIGGRLSEMNSVTIKGNPAIENVFPWKSLTKELLAYR